MQFRRSLQPLSNPGLVPMIDVVFQLVVFFMVSSTFVVTPGIKLDLPQSSSAEPVVMSQLVVSVISPTEIYLNQKQYDLDGFASALSRITADKSSSSSIVVEGDKNVSYDLMVKVLDTLRKNGFRGVNLRTRVDVTGNGAVR